MRSFDPMVAVEAVAVGIVVVEVNAEGTTASAIWFPR
jgi:hypothetical protein